MIDPAKLATVIVEGIVALAVIVLVVWLLRGAGDLIRAPAERDAAIGANHAIEQTVEAQNKAVEGLKADVAARKAKSAAAVASAGKGEEAKAAAVAAAKPAGDTPVARAANFLNAEYAR